MGYPELRTWLSSWNQVDRRPSCSVSSAPATDADRLRPRRPDTLHGCGVHVNELPTPALVIDADALDRNLATMAAAHPGDRLRPHVKAHKCTALAAAQQRPGTTRSRVRRRARWSGMAAAGLGDDLLLANETVDARRLRAMAELDVPVTVAVDSDATSTPRRAAGIRACLIDVNVGLPRCGVAPDRRRALADRARAGGLDVRGVMGYEGHLMMVADRDRAAASVERVDGAPAAGARDVGGDIVSAGGTGTFDLHGDTGVTEVQAGSYALMDTHYGRQGLPFEQALFVIGTVISVSADWSVADVGLKALGMDHGNPTSLDGNGVVLLRRAPHLPPTDEPTTADDGRPSYRRSVIASP